MSIIIPVITSSSKVLLKVQDGLSDFRYIPFQSLVLFGLCERLYEDFSVLGVAVTHCGQTGCFCFF